MLVQLGGSGVGQNCDGTKYKYIMTVKGGLNPEDSSMVPIAKAVVNTNMSFQLFILFILIIPNHSNPLQYIAKAIKNFSARQLTNLVNLPSGITIEKLVLHLGRMKNLGWWPRMKLFGT